MLAQRVEGVSSEWQGDAENALWTLQWEKNGSERKGITGHSVNLSYLH